MPAKFRINKANLVISNKGYIALKTPLKPLALNEEIGLKHLRKIYHSHNLN